VHEHVFYEAVGKLLPDAKRAGYARLAAAWQAHNLRRYHEALRIVAGQLAAAARDIEAVPEADSGLLQAALKAVRLGKGEAKRQEAAMARLVERLNDNIARSTSQLLTLHRLDPGEAGRINSRVRDNFQVRAPLDKTQAGLLGAVVSGAATGLGADLMAGGLTLGGGALLGAIVGALTMAGAAWGFNTTLDRKQPSVQFAPAFLRTLLVSSVLRYLAVAHFGRGRGHFVEGEAPPFWQAAVEEALNRHCPDLDRLWQTVRTAPDLAAALAPLVALLETVVADVFERLYPGAGAAIGTRPSAQGEHLAAQ
jgi:hypothetical protein